MKKLTILLSITFLGLGIVAQPAFRAKEILGANGKYLFPNPDGTGYDLIGGWNRSTIGVARLDANFDSVFFRQSILQLHIGQIRPASDSGYIISGGRPFIGGGRAGMAHLSPSSFVLSQEFSQATGIISNGYGDFLKLPNGEYLTIGGVDSSGTKRRLLISRLDSNFQVIWEKVHDTADVLSRPVYLADGVMMLVINFPYVTTYLHKYDLDGNLMRISNAIPLDSNSFVLDFFQTGPNRFVLVQQYQNQGAYARLTCIDSLGNLIWDRLYNDLGQNLRLPYFWLNKACPTDDGGMLVLGQFGHYLDTMNINQYRSQRLYKYDANGDEEWIFDFAVGNFYLMGQHISVLPDGRILVLSSGPKIINGRQSYQSYIVESVPDSTTSIRNVPGTLALNVQPQPVRDLLEITLSAESAAKAAFTLFDLQGRTLIRRTEALTPGENRITLPVSQLAAGIYLLRAESEGKIGVKKVVVE